MKLTLTMTAFVAAFLSLPIVAQEVPANSASDPTATAAEQQHSDQEHALPADPGHDDLGHEESDHEEPTHEKADHNDDENHDDENHDGEDGHEDEGAHDDEGGHDDEAGTVELDAAAMEIAGIEVNELTFQALPATVSAPGEIILDQYASADVTPLIDAVVVKRQARLGDEVEVGQSLVTLASVEVAEAQGDYRLAATEWNRVRKLGKSSVGAKRYTQSQVAFEQGRLTLRAYGLDDKQIKALSGRDLSGTLGQFDLVSPVVGTVLQDSFRLGERVEAGRRLFLIADESRVWIQANLSPIQSRGIEVGTTASVNMGQHWHTGKVVQRHHMLDEQTRTIPVRIAIEPGKEHHHAGEFVQVAIAIDSDNEETAPSTFVVTESALMRDDEGNWTVFVQIEDGHFRQVPIIRGASRGGQIAISGLAEGDVSGDLGCFFSSQLSSPRAALTFITTSRGL